MRMRTQFLPLLLAASVSCQSTEPTADTPTGSDQDSTQTQPQAQPSAGATATVDSAVNVAASVPVAQDQELRDAANQLQVRRDGAKAIAQQYLAQAKGELDRADVNAALLSYSTALQLDPGNQEAREGLRHVQAILGDEFASAGESFTTQADIVRVKRAQARLEAEDYSTRGDAALGEADYEAAIRHYRHATSVLRFHPLIAEGSLDQKVLEGKLETATARRDEAAVELASVKRAQAEEARRAAEMREENRVANEIESLFKKANQAFLGERFTQAERWTNIILVKDPGNEAALRLRGVARETRHIRADERSRKNYREQWLKTMDEVNTGDVPQVQPLRFDLERWKTVVDRQPLSRRSADIAATSEREAVLAKLEVPFEVDFGGPDGEGTPIDTVATYLQSLTGVNFYVSPLVFDELGEEETNISLKLPRRSVRSVLNLIAETRESLRWKIQDGVVKFITSDELLGGQVNETYSVHGLITPIPDFPGTEINISPSGGIAEPDEDFEEREANVILPSVLEDLIRNNIAPESWDADPGNAIRVTETGTMVVSQTPEVQRAIADLLDDLREATGIMVDIQARFMKVEDNFLEDIGVDFRGLGQPGPGTNGQDFNDFGDPALSGDLSGEIGSGNDIGAFFDEGADGSYRGRMENLYDLQLGNDEINGSGGLSLQWTFLNDLELELILRAVSKSERIELVTAPRIQVHNNSRANLSVLNQVAYVKDFDVEIAQAASIADPIVDVIQDGVILDVR
ncbi:MAG: tetratricopeptide (TPR) repeat protein, partial [Planctomycetota bacterium]